MPASASSAKTIQSYLMRTTGPQPFFTQTFATLQTFNIPKNLPLQLPLSHIIIRVKGRFVIGGTTFTPSPEAPQNIIQRVQLQGTHATLGFLMPIQMSGASLWMYNRLLAPRGNSVYITNGANTGVRVVQENQQAVGLASAGGSNVY